MSKYATTWRQCTLEEYLKLLRKDDLSVYRGYTNPDGRDGISCTPQILTTWGDNDKELIKAHRIRTIEQAQDGAKWEWDDKYYIATEWDEE